jgi:thioredoxin-related protein
MKRFAVLALFVVVPACHVENGSSGSGPFESLTHEQALAKAKSEKKVVMIDFYSDSCPPCKLLDQETFSDGRVRTFLKEKTVAIRVKVENNMELAQKYRVALLPSQVFVNGEGQELGRFPGFAPPEAFIAKARLFVN